MHCRLHVSVELVPHKEHVPMFVATNEESHHSKTRSERERIILRCPVLGCTVVDVLYEPNRTDPTLCRICHKKSVVGTSLCGRCGRKYRASLPTPKRQHVSRASADPYRARLSRGPQ
jgi:hypothetical protein